MKRIFSSLLVVLMLFSLFTVSVSAAEVYTITLTGVDGDTYDAYMIFSATSTGEGENEKIGRDIVALCKILDPGYNIIMESHEH